MAEIEEKLCHIYDLFTFLTDSRIDDLSVVTADSRTGFFRSDDNFSVNLKFKDGTIANLIYSRVVIKVFLKKDVRCILMEKCYTAMTTKN